MRARWYAVVSIAVALTVSAAPRFSRSAAPQEQDYLTHDEANKIRDAYTSNARITLFVDFAADRLQRFQHELALKNAGPRRADFLNSLLDAFTSCVDEADGRVQDGLKNGKDVRKGIADFQKRVPDFLAALKKIQTSGIDLKPFHYALSDSISDLQDDLKDVAKAKKQLEMNYAKPGGPGGDRR